jgi:hypothetical protein
LSDVADGAVVVAYVHSRDVTYSWHHSMTELIGWDLANQHRVMRGGYIAMKCGTDGLADARNKTVKIFLEERRAEWLFWVDTDMGFAADTVDRLLAAADPVERPIVGGLAFTQREETSDGMGGWRCRATPTVFDWAVLDDGQSGFSVRWDYPRESLVQCAGTGSACILIHRSVFERIEAQYGPIWYDRVQNRSMNRLVSEDLAFCLRAGALQIPVHVHTGVKTTHQKVLWLAEDDYFGQVTLAQSVPPAAEPTAVIVPVMRRPQNAAPFMESLAGSGAGDLARVYAVVDPDDTATADAWDAAGARVVTLPEGRLGSFAVKANHGYTETTEPWVLLVGDDVKFHPGWLDHAQAAAARTSASVVGTNDMHNPRVTAGEHATHPMLRRSYVDEQGASWGGPGVLCHEGYGHWFVDDEIVRVAKSRGVWVSAEASRIEHLHPMFGLAEDDEVYQRGQATADQDRELFLARSAQAAP